MQQLETTTVHTLTLNPTATDLFERDPDYRRALRARLRQEAADLGEQYVEIYDRVTGLTLDAFDLED